MHTVKERERERETMYAVWPFKLTLVWTDFRKSSIKVDMTETNSLLASASLHIGQRFSKDMHTRSHANKL